jgi:serine/threonine-protein kinase
MDPYRRRQVSGIFAAALDRAPRERPEFLEQACGADPELRQEVESLLLAHDQEETLGATPATPASPAPAGRRSTRTPDGREASLAPGSCMGPYQVVALLGAGGMGEVYRARDPRLRREVAIKVLSRDLLADPAKLRRFEHEARAAGALNHPNILAVFDIGDQDGVPYVVTELLEGETLKERMQRGPLPLRECLDAARQLAAGLAVAHDHGIVHRDLKPANLFLTRDGRMKILDFGLAKQTAAAEDGTFTTGATLPGTVMGTVGYMSPEQVQGQEVDHRSDLFSFGAVLYEMLAGSRAFASASAVETMLAILTREPPAMPSAREVPPALEQLVRCCLSKDRAARPRRSSELCACLEELVHAVETGAGAPPPKPATVAAGPAGSPAAEPASAPKDRHAVAVLPFVNLTADPDQDYFCEGMADELTHALARLDELRVSARLSVSRFRGKSVEALHRMGERLGVDKVLRGSVRRASDRLRITVQLINVADGDLVWSERYERDMADVFEVQDEIALRVVEALRLRLAAPSPRATRHPGDAEAYQLCLRGRYHWNKRLGAGLRQGLRCFEQAIDKDPGYAPAYAGLADSYAIMGYSTYALLPPHQAMPRAKAAAHRAIEIDPELADAHACLGFVRACYEWDWAAAEADFQRSLALDPGRSATHEWYSILLVSLQRIDAAIAEARRAWELEPLSPIVNAYQLLVACFARRLVEPALAELQQLVEIEPDFAVGRVFLGVGRAWNGEYREAIAEMQPFLGRADAGPLPQTFTAYALGRAGDREEARLELRKLQAAADQRYVPAYCFAMAHAGLGESDEAFAWLERAVVERNGFMTFLAVDPTLDPLRGDARFDALLRRLGLPAGPK